MAKNTWYEYFGCSRFNDVTDAYTMHICGTIIELDNCNEIVIKNKSNTQLGIDQRQKSALNQYLTSKQLNQGFV